MSGFGTVQIDEATLAYAATLDAVVFLLVPLFLMTVVDRAQRPSLRYWAAGGAALATSSLVTAMTLKTDPTWELVVTNALSLLGLGWIFIACDRLLGGTAQRRWVYLLASLIMLTTALLVQVWPHPLLRVGINSLLVATFPVATGWVLLKHRDELNPIVAGTSAGVFFAVALVYISRAVSYLHYAASDTGRTAPRAVATLPLFLEMVFSTWMGAMLAILVSARIQSRLRTERDRVAEANRELQVLSRTDALTGLANRASVDAELARRWPVRDESEPPAAEVEHPLAVLMVDVDHFKRINDTFGHPTGDEVLREVAATMRSTVRDSDTVGRWGGEEFIVLLGGPDPATATEIAERMRDEVARTNYAHGQPVTVSVGVALARPDDTVPELVARADTALYDAKAAGRDRVVCAT